MKKSIVHTDNAPKAIGPYSQAISLGDMIFCSGQIPLDPQTMQIVGTEIEAQTTQVLKNLLAVLKAAGSSQEHVVKTTVFLAPTNPPDLRWKLHACRAMFWLKSSASHTGHLEPISFR
jgi:reactive intermediate/imine deaminase